MDARELSQLKAALVLINELADDHNWYDETPKYGGPNVPAWRGNGKPDEMAHKAADLIRTVARKY